MMCGKEDGHQLNIGIIVLLVVVTIALFWPISKHEFLNYDDNQYVSENLIVRSGLTKKGVIWAFTSFYGANWHPLTWLSHMLDVELFGLNPSAHHMVNVVLHAMNAALLFLVLNRMTGALWRSSFVASLFAFHPLHIESVAWLAERKDVLSAFFWILVMGTYLKYARKPSFSRYMLLIIIFALGLMAKPMLVTMPFIMLLMDYWPLRRFPLRFSPLKGEKKIITHISPSNFNLLLEKIPLFILSIIVSIAAYLAQSKGRTIRDMDMFPLLTRMTNAAVSYATYIWKMIWPVELAVIYPHQGQNISLLKVSISILLLMAASLGIVWKMKKYPYLSVGWFWYIGSLVPVIGIIQIGPQAMADRYTYIPLIGLFIILAWGMAVVSKLWKHGKAVVSFLAIVLLIICIILTRRQIPVWKNSTSLFSNALEVTSKNWLAENNLGETLYNQGRIDEAKEHYLKALSYRPDYAFAHSNLGNVYLRKGNLERALFYYRKASLIDASYAEPLYNQGIIYGRTGNLDLAEEYYRQALLIKPVFPECHNNLATLLIKRGEYRDAIVHLTEALSQNPKLLQAHYNMGFALQQKGDLRRALKHYREALSIQPDFQPARVAEEEILRYIEQGK